MRLHQTLPKPPSGDGLSDLLDLEDQAEDLLQADLYEDAIAAARAALVVDPKSLAAWLVCGEAHKALGRFAEAAKALERVLAHVPGLATVHADIAANYVELERFEEARDHLVRATEIDPSLVQAFANLGSVYIRMGRWDLAEAPTRHAISLDTYNLLANHNLLAINAHGRNLDAGGDHGPGVGPPTFLTEKPLRVEAPVVLILSNGGAGNVPHQHLLSRSRFSRVFWFLEGWLPEHEDEIPVHDVVFNAVGDIDAAPRAHALACEFAKTCKRPMVNLPDRVGRTSRSGTAELLAGRESVLVPKVKRVERHCGAIQSAGDAGLRYPLIARPAGRHGGEGARLIDRPEQLASLVSDAEAIYLTEFVDYRSPDGWYRKYRVIFVDRKPYPCHLAIGAHWMVHYWTAGMEQDEQRRDEERQFVTDPEASLGGRVWQALEAIGATLDLDFVGIDFSVMRDGRLLLFEANPTMLVHPEDDALFAYKNFAIENIIEAFGRMMAARIPRKS